LTGSSFRTGEAPPRGSPAAQISMQINRVTPGDVNGDGVPDINDFHIIRANLFKSGQTRAQGDLVGVGGVVDFADYREWKQNAAAGLAASVSLSGSVPEPSSGLLLAVGAALAVFATRRTERNTLRWAP
jgi:hypothetical protein